jgi:hypothetical protein
MKKYLLLIFLLFHLLHLSAQVILNLQIPPAGLTVKSQLWNMTVVNTVSQSFQAQIEMSMVNAANNQPVLTATTGILTFPKGLKQIHPGDVAPVIYNVQDPSFHVDGSAEGFLPVGTFQLCYSIIRVDLEVSERIAEECETVVIEPISPPQLIEPEDSGMVDLTRPLFSWLPPAPVQLFNNLVYDFSLVRVEMLQTGPDAIQQNIPLETQSNLTVTNLQYPLSLPELDTAHLYAWQIVAKSGGSEVARSEVWTFRVRKDVIGSPATSPVYYSRLRREADAAYGVCRGSLYYEYLNETNDKTIPFRIYDLSNPRSRELLLDSALIDLHYGQNLRMLDLSGSGILVDRHLYLLELINSRKEHWYLKFQYRKKN